jgi:hypothetical protein
MVKCCACVLALFLLVPAVARAQDDQPESHKLIKILVGGGALAVGTAVAATSSQTTTVNSAFGTSETSTFSKSQLITGLAIAGTGGIILWDGLRSHHPSPSTQFGVSASAHARGVFVRKVW